MLTRPPDRVTSYHVPILSRGTWRRTCSHTAATPSSISLAVPSGTGTMCTVDRPGRCRPDVDPMAASRAASASGVAVGIPTRSSSTPSSFLMADASTLPTADLMASRFFLRRARARWALESLAGSGSGAGAGSAPSPRPACTMVPRLWRGAFSTAGSMSGGSITPHAARAVAPNATARSSVMPPPSTRRFSLWAMMGTSRADAGPIFLYHCRSNTMPLSPEAALPWAAGPPPTTRFKAAAWSSSSSESEAALENPWRTNCIMSNLAPAVPPPHRRTASSSSDTRSSSSDTGSSSFHVAHWYWFRCADMKSYTPLGTSVSPDANASRTYGTSLGSHVAAPGGAPYAATATASCSCMGRLGVLPTVARLDHGRRTENTHVLRAWPWRAASGAHPPRAWASRIVCIAVTADA